MTDFQWSLNGSSTTGAAFGRHSAMKAVWSLASVVLVLFVRFGAGEDHCGQIQTSLSPFDGACRCYTSGLDKRQTEDEDETSRDAVWIGCTRKEVLDIYAALNALTNDTKIQKLWIWDSLIPSIPSDFFAKVRPRHLVFESSQLGRFRKGAFSPLKDSIRSLELKNNLIESREVVQEVFGALQHLRRLDLSGNQVREISQSSFGELPRLRTLSLHRNGLERIADGSFVGLRQLRRLNLAGNRITHISATTFKGLDILESLNLENNHISEIDPKAFEHMKKLTSLNLGGNRLSALHLGNLPALQRLRLNNNSFFSLSDLVLENLVSLEVFSLDKNHLETIPSGAFQSVPNLQSLSLASNLIRSLSRNSFKSLHSLFTLSLHNNRLEKLPDAVFFPLIRLRHLFLSNNRLTQIGERVFYGLTDLRVLSLSKNQISQLHRRSLASLRSLERLFLSHNRLSRLTEKSLDYFRSRLYAVDLSHNPWNCDCQLVWLSEWLTERREQLVNEEESRCVGWKQMALTELARSGECGSGPAESTSQGGWVTAIGVILAVVSVLILAAIALLYMRDSSGQLRTLGAEHANSCFRGYTNNYDLRRVPSDMVTLIPKCTTIVEKRVRFDICS